MGNNPMHSARRGLHSETVASLPPSGIRRFFELLDEATGVISLAVGQPDFSTPAQITNAASEAMLAGNTGYTKGYHLHYEVYKNNIRANPMEYMFHNYEGERE